MEAGDHHQPYGWMAGSNANEAREKCKEQGGGCGGRCSEGWWALYENCYSMQWCRTTEVAGIAFAKRRRDVAGRV